MTRVIFSDKVLSITLPKSWEELSQDELREVYALKASVPQEHLPFRIFAFLARCKVVRHSGEGFLCSFTTDDGHVVPYIVSPTALAEMLSPLDFLSSPGCEAVRLDSMRGVQALDAQFHGVSFGVYVTVENLYQGFISSRSGEALHALACRVYPGLDLTDSPLSVAEQLNVLNWMVQLKSVFASSFPHFFRPPGNQTEGGEEMSQLEIMNNEIRILTEGDVTKENDVLSTDCWRTLTELDFKAKEAKEMKERMNKI